MVKLLAVYRTQPRVEFQSLQMIAWTVICTINSKCYSRLLGSIACNWINNQIKKGKI